MARKRVKKRKNKSGMLLITGMVFVLCGFIFFNSMQLKQKLNQYEATEAELKEQIEAEEAHAKALDKEDEYSKTQEYIESIARDKLGLIKDNEIIFKRKNQ